MAIDIPHAAGGSYPLRAGNAVRPWVDGVPAFRRIGEAIEAARRSLWLTVAFFRPGSRRARHILAAKSRIFGRRWDIPGITG